MPANDRDVFEDLTGGEEGQNALSFLTYALFAFERREWIAHHTNANNGEPPTDQQIDGWISNLTPYNFTQMRNQSGEFFDVSARAYMADDVEAARQQTLQSAIVKEVKAAGSAWRQLVIAMATAIAAPVIIGLIVVAALKSEDIIPTIKGIAGQKQEATQSDKPK